MQNIFHRWEESNACDIVFKRHENLKSLLIFINTLLRPLFDVILQGLLANGSKDSTILYAF